MKKTHKLGLTALGTALVMPAVGYGAEQLLNQSAWTEAGLKAIVEGQELARGKKRERAKNVILFVGDGMGVSTITAARILDGQRKGHPGEENQLSFEKFPALTLVKTYSVNQQTPDSAPTMTAMVTGVKTKDGILSVDEDVVRGDYKTVAGNELKTILELAEDHGLSTGVVSTARITHATPAACYAHSPERDWESDAELPDDAKAADFPDIARQLLEFSHGDGIEVVFGGGREYFLPETAQDPEDVDATGRRLDGRDLTAEWTHKHQHSAFVWDQKGFDAIDTQTTNHVLGLFERSHLEYEADRPNDTAGEPSLAQLTTKAIEILSRNEKGFFLMVEAGRVDHAHHAGNAARALGDAIALSEAVQAAVEKVDEADTQILVTADHSHVFTIGGYPARGNDILGKVITLDETGEIAEGYALADDGKPYTTLGYANGPGYRGVGERGDLTEVDTQDVDYLQEATIPLGSETHAAEDVALYARGPSSQLLHGSQEQTISFYLMAHALGFDGIEAPSRRFFWNER
ncbi:MAG: alkaline phosphatase [Polyangiales bacterium]